MEKIIGIDLGTSNSAAAVMMGGRPTIIPSAEGLTLGGKMFPSFVAFTKDGEVLVGEPARRQAVTNPDGTIMAIKRKMGTDYKTTVRGKDFTPQQISALILQKIKTDSEAFLSEPVKKAVITVPAYFNDNQRTATKEAGLIAGLEVVRIINEPTAASLAYGLERSGTEQKILVFDLGGGTLDVTIMDFGEGVFEVVSTSGDTQLGGTDMDNAVMDYIITEFKKETGTDLQSDRTAMQRVREAAEKAKIELSNVLETEISLPFVTADSTGPKHLTMQLTRAKLEGLVLPIVERCRKSIDLALSDAHIQKDGVDKIVMVGGPTRMPIVKKYIESFFGRTAERGVDPMECVAMGAAVQASVISGEVKDILLLDVTPLSLGLETLGGVFHRILDRNTTIPTKKTQIFTTSRDNQVNVDINILQGEREMAQDNLSLGKFTLSGMPFAPRGVPQIEVTFDIDTNGILHVSAKDVATGREQAVTVSGSTRLSKDEIEKMRMQSQKFAEEDKKRREWAEEKNTTESLLYSTEKALLEHGDKMGNAKNDVDSCIKSLRAALDSKNIESVREKRKALTAVIHSASTMMYGGATSTSRYSRTEIPPEIGSTSTNEGETSVDSTSPKINSDDKADPFGVDKKKSGRRAGKSPVNKTDDDDSNKYWEEEDKSQ